MLGRIKLTSFSPHPRRLQYYSSPKFSGFVARRIVFMSVVGEVGSPARILGGGVLVSNYIIWQLTTSWELPLTCVRPFRSMTRPERLPFSYLCWIGNWVYLNHIDSIEAFFAEIAKHFWAITASNIQWKYYSFRFVFFANEYPAARCAA